MDQKNECMSVKTHREGSTYGVVDIPACTNGERECAGLPFPQHAGLS